MGLFSPEKGWFLQRVRSVSGFPNVLSGDPGRIAKNLALPHSGRPPEPGPIPTNVILCEIENCAFNEFEGLTNSDKLAIVGVSSRIGFAGVITLHYFQRVATTDAA